MGTNVNVLWTQNWLMIRGMWYGELSLCNIDLFFSFSRRFYRTSFPSVSSSQCCLGPRIQLKQFLHYWRKRSTWHSHFTSIDAPPSLVESVFVSSAKSAFSFQDSLPVIRLRETPEYEFPRSRDTTISTGGFLSFLVTEGVEQISKLKRLTFRFLTSVLVKCFVRVY
jgi:hypothetical protein